MPKKYLRLPLNTQVKFKICLVIFGVDLALPSAPKLHANQLN